MIHRVPCGLLAAFLIALAWACDISTDGASSHSERAGRVIDGDTLDLTDGRRVRLAGIDTPELRPVPEPYAEQARRRLEELVRNTPLELQLVDPPTDEHGRTLGRLLLADGRSVGAILVEEGLAEVFYTEAQTHSEDYFALERAARSRGRGLWSAVPEVTPAELPEPRHQLIRVRGRVSRVREHGPHRFLDFRHDGRVVLTVAIFEHVTAAMDEDPSALQGAEIVATGRLVDGPRGHPELALLHPSRLEVREHAR